MNLSVYFFFKIVVIKATYNSKPIPNFNHLQQRSYHRKSCSQMFFKIGVPKNFTNFTEKHQCWSLFFNKAAGRRFVTLFKRASNADLFSCEICDTFKNNYFRRTLPVAVVLYLFAASDFFWKFESV